MVTQLHEFDCAHRLLAPTRVFTGVRTALPHFRHRMTRLDPAVHSVLELGDAEGLRQIVTHTGDRHWSRSLPGPLGVMAMMGTLLPPSTASQRRISSVASNPSLPGIWQSMITAS